MHVRSLNIIFSFFSLFLFGCFLDKRESNQSKLENKDKTLFECPDDERLSDSLLILKFRFNSEWGDENARKSFYKLIVNNKNIDLDYEYNSYQCIWKGKIGYCSEIRDVTDDNRFILSLDIFDIILLDSGYLVINNLSANSLDKANYYFYYPKFDSIFVVSFGVDNCNTVGGEDYLGFTKKETGNFAYYFLLQDASRSTNYELTNLNKIKIDKKNGAIFSDIICDVKGNFYNIEEGNACDSIFQNDLIFDWNKWELLVKNQDGRDTVISLK